MSDIQNKSSTSRQLSSKSPPQIVNFFSKPLSPSDGRSSSPTSSNDRKRKLSEQETTGENKNFNSYAKTLQKDAAKISKIRKKKKVGTLVSKFYQQVNSDDHLSDFESPSKKVHFKAPPVIPKKKVTRKRKQPTKQNKNKNALETDIFEKVLLHHSNSNGLNSDDLQMALALSRSLVDTQSSVGESSNISSAIRNADPFRKEDIVRQTFQRFGFKKKDNNDYDYRDFFANSGANKKWISKFTPLTRRSETIQKEKLKKKVKNILHMSEALNNVYAETIQDYTVTSSYLQRFFVPRSPTYTISLAEMETGVEKYYAGDLFPISTLPCGVMLKNWEDIPGRDASPQRNISVACNVNNTKESSGIHNEIDTSEVAERTHEELIDLPQCDVDNILDRSSTVNDLGDNSKILNAKCLENSNSSKVIHSHTTSGADECHFGDLTNPTLDAETATNIELANNRQLSPDMFADYESSANNSLNDDVLLDDRPNIAESRVAADPNNTPRHLHSGSNGTLECLAIISQVDKCNSQELVDEKSQGRSENVGKDAIVLSSDDSNQGCWKIRESNSETRRQKLVNIPSITTLAKHLSFTERLELYNCDPALEIMDDPMSSQPDQLSQESIVISDDEINYSLNHCRGDENQNATKHRALSVPSQESIELSDSESDQYGMPAQLPEEEIEERQSFAALVIGNDSASEKSLDINIDDDVFNSNHTLNDEHLINLSAQELCYKKADSGSVLRPSTSISATTDCRVTSMPSQDSIELSDSEDDPKEITSQFPEDEIEERQSFASLIIGNENDSASEKNFDIEDYFNSNDSLNDEDLVNLSVREMCQQEFVSGSTKPSTSKSFSRTTSDMTFERKMWKPPKTPNKFKNISDDEFDEFDMMVRDNKSPIPTENSIEISDDELDNSHESRHENFCDDLSVLDLPASPPTQCNEFIVQSMDQIYEVRTGPLVSPKPDYENMDSPTRSEHLKKFGLKNFPKHRAVICLEHIYSRLHPTIELDEHDDLDEILGQKEIGAIASDKRVGDIAVSYESCKSLVESHFDLLQENEDIFYLPSAPRAKKPWCLQPLHIAWHNLIYSNATLYDHILQYKPIDIMDIRSLLKSIDLRYETNDIISFLDRKCITFKSDNKRNYAAIKKN